MFEGYDERCEIRVHRAFRLPPIFIGQAGDYSFATAFASYTVAEAQVFRPEREEFDELISIKLLPAMGFAGYRLRSYPLQIKDVTNQLAGLTLARELLAPEELIAALNEMTGLNLKLGEGTPIGELERARQSAREAEEPGAAAPDDTPAEPPAVQKVELHKTAEGLLALATEMAEALRKRDYPRLHQKLLLAQTLAPDDQRPCARRWPPGSSSTPPSTPRGWARSPAAPWR